MLMQMPLALAGRAKLPHQSLGNNAHRCIRNQITLHIHVHQTGHRAGRVIGVQGTQHQMAGNRSLYRNSRRFLVTNLTNHNNIRVLSQNRAQRGGKGQAGFNINLHLIDAVNVGLHRVLNRYNIHRIAVQLTQRRIQRA